MVLRNWSPNTHIVSIPSQLLGIVTLAALAFVAWPLGDGLLSFPLLVVAVVWALSLLVTVGVLKFLLFVGMVVVFGVVAFVSILADLPRRTGMLRDALVEWWRDPVRRGIKANQQLSYRAMRRWPAYYCD